MLALLKLVVLGAIQGVTEFLPISSSGHLVLTKSFLGFPSEGAFLEVTLHAGTLVPILVFYRRRIAELVRGLVTRDAESWRTAGMLVVATVPTGLAYLLVKDTLDRAYQSPLAAATALCVTGVLMMIPVRPSARSASKLSVGNVVLIGIAQAFALTPGISRSGCTIVMARHRGVSAEKAAEFSFLMAVPVLLAAVVLELPKLDAQAVGDLSIAGLAVGMVTAAIVGYVSLVLLIKILAKGKFWMFGLYCVLVGGTAVALLLV
jgi:undecaprenyl-diphosphatase